jgi:hypothetical protein
LAAAGAPASGAPPSTLAEQVPGAEVVEEQTDPAGHPLPPAPRHPAVQVADAATQIRPAAQSLSVAHPQLPPARQACPTPAAEHAAVLAGVHSTQAWDAEHRRPSVQSELVMHSTHTWGMAPTSQWTKGWVVQSASLAQVATQVLACGSQRGAEAGQSASDVQPQMLVDKHTGLAPVHADALVAVQATQVLAFGPLRRQAGVIGLAQSASLVQPTQMPRVTSQTWPDGQSELAAQ